MSQEERYHSFPLSTLAFGDTENRPSAIFQWSLVETGLRLMEKQLDEQTKAEVESVSKADLPSGFDRSRIAIAYVLGLRFFGLRQGCVRSAKNNHAQLSTFVNWHATAHGRSPIVRILHSYIWQVIHKNGMDYRHFAVLCGIYAIIGNKQFPVRITNDRIRAAAMGYSSNKVLFFPASAGERAGTLTPDGAAILEKRPDKAPPLTLDQVRYTIEQLEQDGHFARVKPNRREVFYSHRMQRDELAERILKMKTSRNKLQIHRKADAELAAKIKAAQYKRRDTIKDGKSPRSAHLSPDSTPSGVPSGAPTKFPSNVPSLNTKSVQKSGTEISLTKINEHSARVVEKNGELKQKPDSIEQVGKFLTESGIADSEMQAREFWEAQERIAWSNPNGWQHSAFLFANHLIAQKKTAEDVE